MVQNWTYGKERDRLRFASVLAKSSPRREAGLGELCFDEPDGGPYEVQLGAAVGLAPHSVRMPHAIVVGCPLEKASASSDGRRNGDSFWISHWNLLVRF